MAATTIHALIDVTHDPGFVGYRSLLAFTRALDR